MARPLDLTVFNAESRADQVVQDNNINFMTSGQDRERMLELEAKTWDELTHSEKKEIYRITNYYNVTYNELSAGGFAPAVNIPIIPSNQGFNNSGTDNGVVDSEFFTYSFWAKNITGGNGRYIIASDFPDIRIQLAGTDKYNIILRANNSFFRLSWESDANAMPVDTTWRHYCGWYDGVNVTTKHFQDGVEDTNGTISVLSGTEGNGIDFTDSGIAIGADTNLGAVFGGDISQLAIWNHKIDWSTSANIELVRSSTGKPVILPDDGNIGGLGAGIWVFNKGKDDGHINDGLADNWSNATANITDVQGPAI